MLGVAGGVLLVVVGGAAYSLVEVVRHQSDVTDVYFDAIVRAERLSTDLEDAGTSVEAFVASGYDGALTGLETWDLRPAEASRTRLSEAFGEDSAQVVRADEALDAVRAWRDGFALPAVEHTAATGESTLPVELRRTGGDLRAEADVAVDGLVDRLAADREQSADELATWTRTLFLAVVALAVASLAGAGLVWSTLRRRVLGPLAALSEKAQAVSRGALHQEVSVAGPGEIAALSAAVESMRVSLVEEMATVSASRAEIAEAHRQVTEQAEELRRSNRDLEQFAYVASHDLQEPLRKVASFTQLLQKRYGGQLDDRADQYIEFAVDGAKRMQRLIQDLLGFSRVGRSLEDPAPVDLDEAGSAALSNLESTVEATGAVVRMGGLPTVVGHRSLLVQLFQNLVGNAIKFRDPDRDPEVVVGAARYDGGWELWCRDNGIGVDPQYAERVFVIFQRLHPKDVYEGTGIGLALCKKIVEFHGGTIGIDPPDPDHPGTTVRWTIPDVIDTTREDAEPAGWDVVGPSGTGVALSSTTDTARVEDREASRSSGPAADHKERQ
ncbi:HAMP domain-containing protein [Sanguibacter sp. YZGR15]|uniref:histidine kinase n=2 Tax=Sanguibacter suaedae TaxID=2795737 RepID=A0A934MAC2_9MICO|nr:HAMP domain-containing protein [Sanguibacter suaedae]